jgi:hypothetical protein
MKPKNILSAIALAFTGVFLCFSAPAQTFLTNGLVAYYPFIGNADDASGNGANPAVTDIAQTVDRFGQSGHAAALNGSTSILVLPANLLHLAGSSWASISVWVKVDATNSYQNLFTTQHDVFYIPPPSPFGIQWLVFPGGKLCAQTASDSDRNFSTTTVSPGSWYHVVLVYDGQAAASSNKVRMFFNGSRELVSQVRPDVIPAAIPQDADGAWIGARSFKATGTFVDYLGGAVDDIRIYDRALSDSEVAQLYAIESGPRVDLIKAVKPRFSYLWVGTNYQMQISTDMNNWTNYGAPFTATNASMVYPEYFDVENWAELFFRLR